MSISNSTRWIVGKTSNHVAFGVILAAIRQPNVSHEDRAIAWLIVFVIGLLFAIYLTFVILAIFFKIFIPWVFGLFLEKFAQCCIHVKNKMEEIEDRHKFEP